MMARMREAVQQAGSVVRERLTTRRQIREWLLAALMIVLISALLIAQLPGTLVGASRDDVIILVAPFRDPDGQITQTGRTLATRLAEAVTHDGQGVTARVLASAPLDAAEAVRVLAASDADLLVWGGTAAGALYADDALTPWIALRPTGQFAPNGWDGYSGRFAIPPMYRIASAPVSGQMVLEPLIGALADYLQGRDSLAYMTLDALLATRAELLPTLPLMVQGTILWARSEYPRAGAAYERALAALDPTSDPRTAAMLLNNLGAIQFDAGDARSRETFNQAIALLTDDLGELRFNLGLELLRTSEFAAAIQALEQARNLLPPTAALELHLAHAYREDGQLDDSQAALRNASRLMNLAGNSSLPALREIVRTRLNAEILEQQGLLNLARLLQARSPLIWEIAAAPTLAEDRLRPIQSELDQSWNEGARLQGLWSRRAASYDASGDEWAGKIAVAQLQQAKQSQLERTIWRATLNTEIGRAQRANPDRGIGAWFGALFGNQRASLQARRMLETVVSENPTNVLALLLYGRNLRIDGELAEATRQFEAAALLAPRRPEPLYGLAVVVHETDPERARMLLSQALQLDDRFFPAHELLAQIAERQADWATAIEQRRWLAANRPDLRATLSLASTLRRSGPEGIREAEQLLLEPANQGNVDAMLELSRLYDSLGRLDAVVTTLERAHATAPANDLVAYALGNAYERQGNIRDAEELYRTAIDLQRRNIPAILGLAGLESTPPERRARLYRDALDAGADDPAMLRTIGDQLLNLAEYQAAAEAYQRAIRATPNEPALHLGLARVYLARNAPRDAQNEARQAFELSGGAYPEALVALGDALLLSGDPAAANAAYNDALRQSPRLASARIGLGRAAAAGGNWAVAEGEFRLAIELDPQLPDGSLWLGEALIRRDQPRAAIEAYSQAIALRPRYPEAYFGLAQAQLALNQLEEGRANLDTAITLRPAYAEAYLLRGKFYERVGDVQKASNAYSMAIESNQLLAEPYFRRALLKIQNNQFDTAEADLENAVRRQPSFVEAHYWLGRVYYARARYDAAVRVLREAVALRNGDYVDARFYQGLAEEQLGQRDAAIASFRATLELDRSGEWTTEATAALARLGTR